MQKCRFSWQLSLLPIKQSLLWIPTDPSCFWQLSALGLVLPKTYSGVPQDKVSSLFCALLMHTVWPIFSFKSEHIYFLSFLNFQLRYNIYIRCAYIFSVPYLDIQWELRLRYILLSSSSFMKMLLYVVIYCLLYFEKSEP